MKEVIIIFPQTNLLWSPSTLNLYDSLDQYFNVTILTFSPDKAISLGKLLNKKIDYLSFEESSSRKGIPLITRLTDEVKITFLGPGKGLDPLLTANAKLLIEKIKSVEGYIIAVDFFALWCVQKAGKPAHLFSLEILDNDPYRNQCNFGNILSVLIQTCDRYEYIFGKRQIRTFFIQNAPQYIEQTINYKKRKNTNLIYCGTAKAEFGFFSCIEFLIDYPEYTLTVQGFIPSSVRNNITDNFGFLLIEKRLILMEVYLSPADLNDFLLDYYIGFVFYDAFRFDFINIFNYKTAPSGKLFQYYNAGIPVVAINLPGLKSVEEFSAGILINCLGSKSIAQAISQISESYVSYAHGAHKAAAHYDFKASIAPFLDFVETQV